MRISDWSSDVCSSDLAAQGRPDWHRPGAAAQPSDHVEHPPESRLRLHLQCRGRARSGGCALSAVRYSALAHYRGGGDGALFGERGHQRAAPPPESTVNIGETSRQSGVSERMIRHYEKNGLIPATAGRGAGYRDYGRAEEHTSDIPTQMRTTYA